jgi:hypothetical protein
MKTQRFTISVESDGSVSAVAGSVTIFNVSVAAVGPQGLTGPRGPQGNAGIVASPTAPENPEEGLIWFQTVT